MSSRNTLPSGVGTVTYPRLKKTDCIQALNIRTHKVSEGRWHQSDEGGAQIAQYNVYVKNTDSGTMAETLKRLRRTEGTLKMVANWNEYDFGADKDKWYVVTLVAEKGKMLRRKGYSLRRALLVASHIFSLMDDLAAQGVHHPAMADFDNLELHDEATDNFHDDPFFHNHATRMLTLVGGYDSCVIDAPSMTRQTETIRNVFAMIPELTTESVPVGLLALKDFGIGEPYDACHAMWITFHKVDKFAMCNCQVHIGQRVFGYHTINDRTGSITDRVKRDESLSIAELAVPRWWRRDISENPRGTAMFYNNDNE